MVMLFESHRRCHHQKILILVVRLHENFSPKSSSSDSVKMKAATIGIKARGFAPYLQVVLWKRDTSHLWNLNIDGSCKDDLGSGGGVIRCPDCTHFSNLFYFFGSRTRIYAETMALLRGLVLCVQLNVLDVPVGCNSELVLNWLLGLLSKHGVCISGGGQ